MKNKTRDMALIALFAALICIGAYIKIPLPLVPLTLQLLFVMTAADLLGSFRAGMSTLLYLLMGLTGLPVFASGGGISYVFKPTFGFFLGFVAAAFLIGFLVKKAGMNMFLANLIGLLAVYLFGTSYCWLILKFYMKDTENLGYLLTVCVLYPLAGDLAKCALAAFVSGRISKAVCAD